MVIIRSLVNGLVYRWEERVSLMSMVGVCICIGLWYRCQSNTE